MGPELHLIHGSGAYGLISQAKLSEVLLHHSFTFYDLYIKPIPGAVDGLDVSRIRGVFFDFFADRRDR